MARAAAGTDMSRLANSATAKRQCPRGPGTTLQPAGRNALTRTVPRALPGSSPRRIHSSAMARADDHRGGRAARSFAFGEADRVLHVYTHCERTRRRRREGRAPDEEPLRRPARAVLPRRAVDPPGPRRARDGHRRLARPLPRRGPDRPVPAPGRAGRARGDAPAVHRGGAERPGVPRADPLPRRARRPSSPARPRPALDPLVLSFQLKLLWVSGFLPHLGSCVECGADDGARRVPAGGGRRRVRRLRPGRDRALAGGSPRARSAARVADRGRAGCRARRPRGARRPRRRDLVVRAPRRLPPADAVAS